MLAVRQRLGKGAEQQAQHQQAAPKHDYAARAQSVGEATGLRGTGTADDLPHGVGHAGLGVGPAELRDEGQRHTV